MRHEVRLRDGITYHCFETDNKTEGEVAIKQKRVTVKGKGSLTIALNQAKFPDQGIAQLYNLDQTAYRVEPGRAADTVNRIQIWFDVKEYLDMMRATLKEFG